LKKYLDINSDIFLKNNYANFIQALEQYMNIMQGSML